MSRIAERYIEPMLATLVKAPFDDPDWLFEVKWDGFRVEAVVGDGDVRLWTRGKQDAAEYFGPGWRSDQGRGRDAGSARVTAFDRLQATGDIEKALVKP